MAMLNNQRENPEFHLIPTDYHHGYLDVRAPRGLCSINLPSGDLT